MAPFWVSQRVCVLAANAHFWAVPVAHQFRAPFDFFPTLVVGHHSSMENGRPIEVHGFSILGSFCLFECTNLFGTAQSHAPCNKSQLVLIYANNFRRR